MEDLKKNYKKEIEIGMEYDREYLKKLGMTALDLEGR